MVPPRNIVYGEYITDRRGDMYFPPHGFFEKEGGEVKSLKVYKKTGNNNKYFKRGLKISNKSKRIKMNSIFETRKVN